MFVREDGASHNDHTHATREGARVMRGVRRKNEDTYRDDSGWSRLLVATATTSALAELRCLYAVEEYMLEFNSARSSWRMQPEGSNGASFSHCLMPMLSTPERGSVKLRLAPIPSDDARLTLATTRHYLGGRTEPSAAFDAAVGRSA